MNTNPSTLLNLVEKTITIIIGILLGAAGFVLAVKFGFDFHLEIAELLISTIIAALLLKKNPQKKTIKYLCLGVLMMNLFYILSLLIGTIGLSSILG